MRRPSSRRRPRSALRRPGSHRPGLQVLEDRLPPGNAFGGGLLAGATAAAALAPDALALTTAPALGTPAVTDSTSGSTVWPAATSPPANIVHEVRAVPPSSMDHVVATIPSALRWDTPLFSGWNSDPLAAADPFAETASPRTPFRLAHPDAGPRAAARDAAAASPAQRSQPAPRAPEAAATTPAAGSETPAPVPVPVAPSSPGNGADKPPAVGDAYDAIPQMMPNTPCPCDDLTDTNLPSWDPGTQWTDGLSTWDRPNSPVSTALGVWQDPADAVLENYGAVADNPSMYSQAPVRYADGAVKVDVTDITADGFWSPWPLTRSFASAQNFPVPTVNGTNLFGNGVVNSLLPYLVA